MNKQREDWLSALTIMGRILIFVPVIISFFVFISSFFGQNVIAIESAIEGPSTVILQRNIALETLTGGTSMIFLCGVTILVYVAIKRFRQGVHGELDIEKERTE